MRYTYLLLLSLLTTIYGCQSKPEKLPVYGNKIPATKVVDGKTVTDSLDFTLPDFALLNQDSALVTANALNGKITVTDFFFTSCPSICPKMKKEMLRVYDKYQNNPKVGIISYSIDPARDTVGRLHAYAQKLGITGSEKWQFLTGPKDSIYAIAAHYLVSAAEDPNAPGGHVHSGNFILVDGQRRLRGYYDGTDEKSVDKLLTDIDRLLTE